MIYDRLVEGVNLLADAVTIWRWMRFVSLTV